VPVDEHDRNFVGEFTAELFITIHIDFAPAESAPSVQFDQCFFNNLAKMATFAGIDDDLAAVLHGESLAMRLLLFQCFYHNLAKSQRRLQRGLY